MSATPPTTSTTHSHTPRPFGALEYRAVERILAARSTPRTLSGWGRFLGDATLTAAILDRLAMHAIRIDIDGPSYRQHVGAERAGQRPAPLPPSA